MCAYTIPKWDWEIKFNSHLIPLNSEPRLSIIIKKKRFCGNKLVPHTGGVCWLAAALRASPSSSFFHRWLKSLFAPALTCCWTHTLSSDVENELSWWMKMSLTFTLIWLNVLSARQICLGAIWSVMTTQTTALTALVIPYLFPLVHIQLLSWWIQLELVPKYKEILERQQ